MFRGTFLSPNYADIRKQRGFLVNHIGEVCFEKHQNTVLENAVFNKDASFGALKPVLQKFGITGISNHASGLVESMTNPKEQSQTIYKEVKIFAVEYARWTPSPDEFLISCDAMECLLKLDCYILENPDEVERTCLSFFKRFGSHFHVGPFTFGGFLLMGCHYQGKYINTSIIEYVKKESDFSPEKKDAREKPGEREMEESGIQEENSSDGSQTLVNDHCCCIDGSDSETEVGTFSEWKRNLKENKRLWVVVSKGVLSSKNLFGIWTLVRKHGRHFHDADKIASVLSSCWLKHHSSSEQTPKSFVSSELESSQFDIKSSLQNWRSQLKSECLSDEHQYIVHELLLCLENYEKRFGRAFIMNLKLHSDDNFVNLLQSILKTYTKGNSVLQSLRILRFCEQMKYSTCVQKFFENESFYANICMLEHEIKEVGHLIHLLKSKIVSVIDAFSRFKFGQNKYLRFKTKLENKIRSLITDLFRYLLNKQNFTEALFLVIMSLILGFDMSRENEDYESTIVYDLENKLAKCVSVRQLFERNIKTFGAAKCQAWLLVQLHYHHDNKWKDIHSNHSFLKSKAFMFEPEVSSIIDGLTVHRINACMCNLFHFCGIAMSVKNERSKFSLKFGTNQRKCVTPKKISKLLEKIEFDCYFPGKLTIQDALQIQSKMSSAPEAYADIPWAILRKIICIDHNYRDKILNEFMNRKRRENQEPTQKGLSQKLHPSDVFLAIFQCCDPFLKQKLVEKICVCQMAIPFIYTDFSTDRTTISLWPLRQIFLDDGPKSVVSKEIKTISFIRVGDTKFQSKSHLINVFLRDHYHDTFFHKNCPLGTVKRTISNGVVEITWYIPKTKSTQHLSTTNQQYSDGKPKRVQEQAVDEPLTILNLRGDASKYDKHLETVLHISDITIVLADFQTLTEKSKHERVLCKIHQSDANVIIITDKLSEDSDIETSNESDNGSADSSDSDHTDSKLNCLSSKQDNESPNVRPEDKFRVDYIRRMEPTKKVFFCSLVEQGNDTEVREYLVETLKDILPDIDSGKCLEEKTFVLPTDCFIDEEIVECRYGKELAHMISSEIQAIGKKMEQGQRIKDSVVPLQSETMWQRWSKLENEEYRFARKGGIDAEESNKNNMKTVRVMQVLSCTYKSDILFRFMHILNDFESQYEITQFFLHWLKQNFDSQSKVVLPKLERNLLELSRRYESLRSETKLGKMELENMQKEIDMVEKDLAYSSFGLEHLFREMGQVYESFQTFENQRNSTSQHVINKLPFLAAKLLIQGQPLEIMDGDTASIPLTWVNAVFSKLKEIVGIAKRVLIVSVLGIQSSGKSTLLNTMFGLKFSVSAGRCTRGIFIQLIRVDKTTSKLKYDYAIIIDTEGLRAPELAGEKTHHDNKLATLVIGLADVAIINLKGENITDIQDVLQIVVHALIRLKHANENIHLQQSCIFVHQNVSDDAAKEKTFRGSRKTVQQLDDMTHQAAEEEQIVNIKYFNEVIAFDPTKHIRFFPDLWHGRPPMAPASPEYSESAIEALNCILYGIVDQRKSFLTIENISLHLQCLWKGIMSENFVFSFRNALEVKAYGLLEKTFQRLCWSLEELKLTFLDEDIKPTLRNCKKGSEIKFHVKTLKDRFADKLKTGTETCKRELDEFFENAELNEYMIHWKGRKTHELHMISKDIMSELNAKLNEELQRCQKLYATNEHLSVMKRDLTEKVFELAKISKGNKDLDLDSTFDKHWKEWLDEYAPDEIDETVKSNVQNMEGDLVRILGDKLESLGNILQPILRSVNFDQMYADAKPLMETMTIENLTEKHISIGGTINKLLGKIKKNHKQEYLSAGLRVIHRVFEKIQAYFDALDRTTEYNHSQFSRVVQIVKDGFSKHNNAKDTEGFTLTPSCEIDTVMRVLNFSYHKFKEMIENYEREHSSRIHMERYKEEVKIIFMHMYEEKANYILTTEIICSDLKAIVEEKIVRNFAVEVTKQITFQHFGNRKYSMLKEILTNLANERNFKQFMEYIEHFDLFLEKWIKQYTINVYNEKINGRKSLFEQSMESKTFRELQNVIHIVKHVNTKETPSFANWVDMFAAELEDAKYILPSHSFQAARGFSVKNIEELSVHMVHKLELMELDIYEEIKNKSMEGIQWKNSSPYEEIKATIWKCMEVCPLCHEPCALSSPTDMHCCVQHKPNGTTGNAWVDKGDLTYESCSYKISLQDRSLSCCGWCNCPEQTKTFHHYKDYKRYIPNWNITSTPETVCPTYWAWFMAQFSEELAKHHGKKIPQIPDSFKYISKEDAISSLSVYD